MTIRTISWFQLATTLVLAVALCGCIVPAEPNRELACTSDYDCVDGICTDGRCASIIRVSADDASTGTMSDMELEDLGCQSRESCDSGPCETGECEPEVDAAVEPPPPPLGEDPDVGVTSGPPAPTPSRPCLRLRPAEVNFENVAINVTQTRFIELFNCGSDALKLEGFSIDYDDQRVFGFDGVSTLTLVQNLSGPNAPGLAPGATAIMTISFRPAVPGRSYTGEVSIKVLGLPDFHFTVRLVGRGVPNRCPIPGVLETAGRVAVGEPFLLDASTSADPDGPNGMPVVYDWQILRRPRHDAGRLYESITDEEDPSAGGPNDDVLTPRAIFVTNEPGSYVVAPFVTDEGGLTAPSAECPNSAVAVEIQVGD